MLRSVVLLTLLLAIPAVAEEPASLPRMAVQFRALDDAAQPLVEPSLDAALDELAKTKRFELLARGDLEKALGVERAKMLAGCEDGACVSKLGKRADARFLLQGTLAHLGNTLRVELKLFTVKEGDTLARAGSVGFDDGFTVPYVRSALPKLLEMITADGQPVKVERSERKITTSLGDDSAGPAPTIAAPSAPAPKPQLEAKPAFMNRRLDLPLGIVAGGVAVAGTGIILMRYALAFDDEKLGMTFDEATLARESAHSKLVAGEVIAGLGTAVVAGGTTLLVLRLLEKDAAHATLVPIRGGAIVSAGMEF